MLGLLLGILVLNVFYLGLYIFVAALLFLIKTRFLEGFCYLTLWPCTIELIYRSSYVQSVKHLQLTTVRYNMTYVLNGFTYFAVILLDIVVENYERVKDLGTVRSA